MIKLKRIIPSFLVKITPMHDEVLQKYPFGASLFPLVKIDKFRITSLKRIQRNNRSNK